VAAVRSNDGPRAIVVNVTRVGDGVWQWSWQNRADDWRDQAGHPWAWGSGHDWRSHDEGIWVWHGAFASSGSGGVAISENTMLIRPGLWFWPSDRLRADDWPWGERGRFTDWFQHGNGLWLWPGRIGIANLAAARSGNGSLAVVTNVVQIGRGLWQVPLGHAGIGTGDWRWPRNSGSGIWVLSSAVARSSSGTLAISSHAVRIDTGIWLLPSGRDPGHTWLGQGERFHVDAASIDTHGDNADSAIASPSGKLEPVANAEAPASNTGEETVAAAPSV
jgi:hypothetical protein